MTSEMNRPLRGGHALCLSSRRLGITRGGAVASSAHPSMHQEA